MLSFHYITAFNLEQRETKNPNPTTNILQYPKGNKESRDLENNPKDEESVVFFVLPFSFLFSRFPSVH